MSQHDDPSQHDIPRPSERRCLRAETTHDCPFSHDWHEGRAYVRADHFKHITRCNYLFRDTSGFERECSCHCHERQNGGRRRNRSVIDYTRILHRAQLRALRRLSLYGQTDADEDERLTGQAEELERELALRLLPHLQESTI